MSENKINFLTFGNEKYYNSLERIKNEALSLNIFNEILIYNDKTLQNYPEFWQKHSEFILNNSRGYGYWIWKSYLTMKTLETMNNNDILIYADAGCSLNNEGIARLHEYFDLVKNSDYGILSFNVGLCEKTYTKMDLFEYMNMNNEKELNDGQLVGGIFIIKKCDHSVNLVNMWYNIMSNNYNLIDNSPSNLPNDNSFVEHRHDQSVFSLLRKKYGSVVIHDETWYPNFNEIHVKNYPILAKRSIC
jgi:hypothetical protein